MDRQKKESKIRQKVQLKERKTGGNGWMKGKRRQEGKSQNGWTEGGEVMKEGKMNGRREGLKKGMNEKKQKECRTKGWMDGWMN